ncbi:MAG: hypothetical protein IJ341_02305 [Bacteroidales bacterium]|nr:hypothetical protein [Bacteroidales bacterium]
MTEIEFENYLKTLTDPTDYAYACEVWDSLTVSEKENCTSEKMNSYVEDTYLAVSEQGCE